MNHYDNILTDCITFNTFQTNRISRIDPITGSKKMIITPERVSLKQGEKIALVGESGSGKTTLVKLLMNFYQAEKGEILLNNYNIKDIDLEALRDKIAYISQETFLFSGTILENLTLGMDNPDMEEVIRVTKMTRCFDFINELPMRFETMLVQENIAEYKRLYDIVAQILPYE